MSISLLSIASIIPFCNVGFPHVPTIQFCFPNCRNNLRPCTILPFSRVDSHLLLPRIWTLAIWHHLNPMLRTDSLVHQVPESWVAIYVKNGFTFSCLPTSPSPRKHHNTTQLFSQLFKINITKVKVVGSVSLNNLYFFLFGILTR